jgi:hypothetical protein
MHVIRSHMDGQERPLPVLTNLAESFQDEFPSSFIQLIGWLCQSLPISVHTIRISGQHSRAGLVVVTIDRSALIASDPSAVTGERDQIRGGNVIRMESRGVARAFCIPGKRCFRTVPRGFPRSLTVAALSVWH